MLADRVMRMATNEQPVLHQAGANSALQRSCCSSCAGEGPCADQEEGVYRFAAGEPRLEADGYAVAPSNAGAPLPKDVRDFFEPRLGADFAGVRIHTDSRAASAAESFSAHAFTVGNDISFAAGTYHPTTTQGRRLLAHELVHTIQQGTAATCADNPWIVHRQAHQGPVFPEQAGRPPADLRCPVANQDPANVVLETLFGNDEDSLDDARRDALDQVIRNWHAAGNQPRIQVHAYSSTRFRGSRDEHVAQEYNWRLSCRRALAVVAALQSPRAGGLQGIPNVSIERFVHGQTTQFGVEGRNRRATVSFEGPRPTHTPAPLPTPAAAARPLPRHIRFWFHAFIPNTLSGAHIQRGGPFAGRQVFEGPPLPGPHWNSCFETDERTFNPAIGASSRLRFLIDFDTSTGTASHSENGDLTFEVDCGTGAYKCSARPAPSAAVTTVGPALPSSRRYDVLFDATANDPCVFGSPDIAIRGNLIIDLARRQVDFRPLTTIFPSIEMYADAGAGVVTCFRQAAVGGVWSLFFVPGVTPHFGTFRF